MGRGGINLAASFPIKHDLTVLPSLLKTLLTKDTKTEKEGEGGGGDEQNFSFPISTLQSASSDHRGCCSVHNIVACCIALQSFPTLSVSNIIFLYMFFSSANMLLCQLQATERKKFGKEVSGQSVSRFFLCGGRGNSDNCFSLDSPPHPSLGRSDLHPHPRSLLHTP